MITLVEDDVDEVLSFKERLKKIAEENPDLPLGFIRDALISIDEVKRGLVEPYQFGNVNINNDD